MSSSSLEKLAHILEDEAIFFSAFNFKIVEKFIFFVIAIKIKTCSMMS
jgi:hypothetical protein